MSTATSSIASRVAARRDQIKRLRTRVFDIPGYEGILAVELRVLSQRKLDEILARHETQRDESTANLYAACDVLTEATVRLLEQEPNGDLIPLDALWGEELGTILGIQDMPDGATPRQALLSVVVIESRIRRLFRDFERWQQGETRDADQEAMGDSSGQA